MIPPGMTEEDTKTPYILDSAPLIDVKDHFPELLRKLKKLVGDGLIKIPDSVLRELSDVAGKSDKATQWVQSMKNQYQDFVVSFSGSDYVAHQIRQELSRIAPKYGPHFTVGKQTYPGFWSSRAGRKAAEGKVIAVAKVLKGTVVSNEKTVRGACLLERVPCIGWEEFVRQAEELIGGPLRLF